MLGRLLDDFKQFALRGNMIDLAVGIIIGAKFNALVQAMVDDLIMPPISKLLGKTNFEDIDIGLGKAPKLAADGTPMLDEAGNPILTEAAIEIGSFVQVAFNFLIIAFCVFLIVRLVNKAQKALMDGDDREATPKEKNLPEDIQLLRQIRNELRQLNGENADGQPVAPIDLGTAMKEQE